MELTMEAAAALALVRDPVAADYLRRIIESDRLVDEYAIQGLERLGTSEARAVLEATTHNRHRKTAELARAALQRLRRQRKDGAPSRHESFEPDARGRSQASDRIFPRG